MAKAKIHASAEVSPRAKIGSGTSIWNWAQVREGAVIGRNCIIGKSVYIDFGVRVGNNCKIQNNASIYHGVKLEDGVFIGPHAVITNDLRPRAVNPEGSLKQACDWSVTKTVIREGASIGAGSVIVCGSSIGKWAMVGAGSIITREIPAHALAFGNPARVHGFVCRCGRKLVKKKIEIRKNSVLMKCGACKAVTRIPKKVFEEVEQAKK